MKKLLTYERVVDAATSLLKDGRQPSASAVVQHLGSGSKTTAVKYLDQWRDTLTHAGFRLPPDMPETLMPAIEQFWTAAIQIAGQQLESDRLTYAEQNRCFEAERDAALAACTQAEKALEESQSRVREQAAEMKGLRGHMEAMSAEIPVLRERLAQAQSETAAEREQGAARLAAARKEAAQERASQEQARQAVEAELAKTIDRADSSERRWMMEIAATRDRLKENEAAMRDERKQLRAELKQAEQVTAAARNDRNQVAQRALRAEDRMESLQAEHQRVIEQASTQQDEWTRRVADLERRNAEQVQQIQAAHTVLVAQANEFSTALQKVLDRNLLQNLLQDTHRVDPEPG